MGYLTLGGSALVEEKGEEKGWLKSRNEDKETSGREGPLP